MALKYIYIYIYEIYAKMEREKNPSKTHKSFIYTFCKLFKKIVSFEAQHAF